MVLIIVGALLLACAGWYELNTSRDALFPPTAFKNITIGKLAYCFSKLSYVDDISSYHSDRQLSSQFRIQRRDILFGSVLPGKEGCIIALITY